MKKFRTSHVASESARKKLPLTLAAKADSWFHPGPAAKHRPSKEPALPVPSEWQPEEALALLMKIKLPEEH